MAGRRAPVRSSARLSNSGGAAGGGGGSGSSGSGGRQASERAAAAAAAAARRARAAERAREVEDSPSELRDKCRRLARALMNAKHLVVYTGAGISTAADIPDYRGPHGVWTRLQRGEAVGRVEVARARPTFTHMALTALWARGTLKFVVSQNCDGLHVRAGLPRRALAELHGDMFAERCAACRRVYLRAFDTTERTARHAHGTRRLCHACGAELRDTIVHFGERGRAAWPLNWAGALRHAAAADVVLCLGSSLKVLRRYPRLWRMHSAPRARPDLYIVNLQWTPKDAVAKLKINARCDAVMAAVARRLRLRVPRYCARRDPLLAHAEPLLPPEAHTTRRAPLRPPPPGPCSPSPSPSPSLSPSGSSSESDDEVPLRRLAERLRAEPPAPPDSPPLSPPPPPPPPAPPPSPPPPPPQFPSPILKWPLEGPPPPAARAPTRPTLVPLPDLLHAFQVNMKSGDATILLRAEHAPSAGGAPRAPRAAPRALSQLRRFRMPRAPPPANGLALPAANGLPLPTANGLLLPTANGLPPPTANGLAPIAVNGAWCRRRRPHCAPPAASARDARRDEPKVNLERTTDGDREPKIETKPPVGATNGFKVEPKPETDISPETKSEIEVRTKSELELRMKSEPELRIKSEPELRMKSELEVRTKSDLEVLTKTEAESEDGAEGADGAGSVEGAWAAALIARAVLACRAQLYPGLHSMIAAEPAPTCAWCARHRGARRCLWYGAPALTPPARRAARRVRARRYLCACCPAPAAAAPAAPATPALDDSGWYGKGYRKGRRRKRPA